MTSEPGACRIPASICQPVPGFSRRPSRDRECRCRPRSSAPGTDELCPSSCPVKTHERVREIVALEIQLRRKVVRFGFAIPADLFREFVALVHVVRNGSEIVEELAQQIESAILAHDVGAEEVIAGDVDRLLQQDPLTLVIDVAQALIFASARPVVGLRCR